MRLTQQSRKKREAKKLISRRLKEGRVTELHAGRHVHGLRSSELKRKFQAALPDSQINDSKVSATSAIHPVSNWRKFD